MARTSRKQTAEASIQPYINANEASTFTTYKTGIYVRLSAFNSGNETADTMENQIELIKEYISKQKDLTFAELYCDNGRTGTNFERPEFNRLMDDIKLGKINCIVVKDLSRFGRNFIETGNYIENIFPYFNVRFIAIGDNYDSLTDGNDGLIIALKNLVNDYYARDISVKTLSSIGMKQREGKYLGGVPPYGYLRDEADKYKLIPDEKTAPVVKKIFEMRAEGNSNLSISRFLNKEGIPSPFRYRYEMGFISTESSKDTLWMERTINFILTNKMYIGAMMLKKTKGISYKSKKRLKVSEEDMIITEDTHEPLVDKELFEKVNRMLEQNKNRQNKEYDYPDHTEDVLKGKVFCGYCGAKLNRLREKQKSKNLILHYKYRCRNYSENKDLACRLKGRVNEADLKQAVYYSLKAVFELTYDDKPQVAFDADEAKEKSIDSQRRLIEIKTEKRNLFEELSKLSISSEEYKDLSDKLSNEEKTLTDDIHKLQLMLKASKNNSPDLLKEFQKFDEEDMTFKKINRLIKSIKVYNEKRVDIEFDFSKG